MKKFIIKISILIHGYWGRISFLFEPPNQKVGRFYTHFKKNEVGPQLSCGMVGPGFLNLTLSENYRQKCFFAFNPKSIFRNDDRKERVDAER